MGWRGESLAHSTVSANQGIMRREEIHASPPVFQGSVRILPPTQPQLQCSLLPTLMSFAFLISFPTGHGIRKPHDQSALKALIIFHTFQ